MSKGNRNWGELIREQLASGQSQADFCRQRGLSLSSFQYQKSKRAHGEEGRVFVALTGEEKEERIEVRVGPELRLYFPAGTPSERLSELVRCLSSK